MDPSDEDLWTLLEAAAERLKVLSDDTVTVWAYRRRRPLRVTEGLDAGDKWVYGLAEPVRWRRPLSSVWHQVQTVDKAATKIEAFLRVRPDQRAFE